MSITQVSYLYTALQYFTYLPTIISSLTDAFRLKVEYISIVNNVLALLNIEVKSLIKAASITDSITPFNPKIQQSIRLTYPSGTLHGLHQWFRYTKWWFTV